MQASTRRAAICARVSTIDQTRGTSLDTQVAEGHEYARNHGLHVVGEYIDGGVSGKYAHRPGLDRLMEDCRAGFVDVVIVSKFDRFGRSFRHTVQLVGELEELGIEFVSIAERIDSSPSGRFQRHVLLSVAEFERERILERTTKGMEATAFAGHWPAGPAPYGWKVVKDASGHSALALNEPEVAVWERIVSCFVDKGMSSLETAKELNAAGFRRRHGQLWEQKELWKLVRDTTCLTGTWTYRRQQSNTRRRQARSGPPITLSIPPILTPERYEALRAVIKARSWSRKQQKHDWLLAGRVWSPHGRRMHGMHDAHGKRRYRCGDKVSPEGGLGKFCDCHLVHADDIEAQVWDAVTKALSEPVRLLALASAQAQMSAEETRATDSDLAAMDRKIARLERDAGERLAKALAAGVDPKVAAVAAASLQAEIEAARQQRTTVAAWVASAAERRSRTQLLTDIAKEAAQALGASDDVPAKQRVLKALNVKVTVTGWAVCETCGGTGRLKGGRGNMCRDCHGMRYVALVDIDGAIPSAAQEDAAPWPIKLAAS